MAKIVICEVKSKVEWENFIKTKDEANFLHSWCWGEFHRNLNKQIYRIGFYANNKLIGVMLSVIEKAKRGKYMTVSGGPIIDWTNKDLVKSAFKELKELGNVSNCAFIRVRPQIVENEFSKKLFLNYSFRYSPMHLTADLTSQLNLVSTEEELIKGMRKTTRYEIKRADKLGIKIEKSTDPNLIKKFYNLQVKTAKRHNFVPFGYNFLYQQFKVFSENNSVKLYTAKLNNVILAQAFIIFYNSEAVYHYGVGTEEGRRFPGAYLIQWEAIKDAREKGYKIYNFWGVAPEGNRSHRFSGVSLFKRGFGGNDVQYMPAQDMIINKPKYLLNLLVESIRKKLRGLA